MARREYGEGLCARGTGEDGCGDHGLAVGERLFVRPRAGGRAFGGCGACGVENGSGDFDIQTYLYEQIDGQWILFEPDSGQNTAFFSKIPLSSSVIQISCHTNTSFKFLFAVA